MTHDEKMLVRQDPTAAATNGVLLAAVAARSGYSGSAVRDMITTYQFMADRIDAYAAWKESGRDMPDINDEEERTAVEKQVKKEKQQGELGLGVSTAAV